MQDDRFDADIKKLLQDFEGHDDPTDSWSQMSDRLDKELPQSQDDIEEFDQSIRTKMENYSIPVSDKDWIKLKDDLNNAEERKEKIIISKAIMIIEQRVILMNQQV